MYIVPDMADRRHEIVGFVIASLCRSECWNFASLYFDVLCIVYIYQQQKSMNRVTMRNTRDSIIITTLYKIYHVVQ